MANLERLYHTVQTLATTKDSDFYLGFWAEDKERGCGTVGCAFGIEATTKYANDNGLRLTEDPTFIGMYHVSYKGVDNFHAASRYYDISLGDTMYLFNPASYLNEDKTRRKTVMKRIEKFICEKSKEMKEHA